MTDPAVTSAAVEGIAMVKQVDNETVAEVLRIRQAIDPAGTAHAFDEGEAHPWVALLRGFAHQDVIDAVWAHYVHEARAVWPADVIARMEALAAERQRAALAAKESAQEEQTDWSDQDKAAWDVAWDRAVGRGEPVRKARDEADETHPKPPQEPDVEADAGSADEQESAAEGDGRESEDKSEPEPAEEPEGARESADGDADAEPETDATAETESESESASETEDESDQDGSSRSGD